MVKIWSCDPEDAVPEELSALTEQLQLVNYTGALTTTVCLQAAYHVL